MNAIELEANVDANNELHLKLPEPYRGRHARVIVLFPTDDATRKESVEPSPVRHHRPSPRLTGQGARLHGDDIAPAFSEDDWGSLAQ